MLRKNAIKLYRRELAQYIFHLASMDSNEIAFLMKRVMLTRAELLVYDNRDFMQPYVLEAQKLAYCQDEA